MNRDCFKNITYYNFLFTRYAFILLTFSFSIGPFVSFSYLIYLITAFTFLSSATHKTSLIISWIVYQCTKAYKRAGAHACDNNTSASTFKYICQHVRTLLMPMSLYVQNLTLYMIGIWMCSCERLQAILWLCDFLRGAGWMKASEHSAICFMHLK